MLFQYTKTPEGAFRFTTTDTVATVKLSTEWKKYSFDHTITKEGTQKVGLDLAVKGSLLLDDVWVSKR